MPAFAIKPLTASPQTLDALADILVETVAAGGSVHFMHPLAFADARGFWAKAFAAAARGERIVLGAYDGETLISTVSLLLDTPPNQRHRAEIGKMMTHPRHRGRGAAAALLAEAGRRHRRRRRRRRRGRGGGGGTEEGGGGARGGRERREGGREGGEERRERGE